MISATEAIGMTAGTLTTLAFVPQVLQVWRSKSARDINLVTFGMFSAGVALWLVFGLLIGSLSVVITNAVTLLLALAILALKLLFREPGPQAGETNANPPSAILPDREKG